MTVVPGESPTAVFEGTCRTKSVCEGAPRESKKSATIRGALAFIPRRFALVFWIGFFTVIQSVFLIGLESAEGYPLPVNDIPQVREIPKNTPYHDVFMGTLPSSRRGNTSPFSVGKEQHKRIFLDRHVKQPCDRLKATRYEDFNHSQCLNGDWYRAMITNIFIPELNNHDVQELWFQQDGVSCHAARATIDFLRDTFGDRLISRFGPVNWPPRSCDLTPLDYFLWGYVKSLVYADKPQTLDHLEDNIRRVIANIRPQIMKKIIENWTSRLDYIPASRGNHMPEIIFKM
ncbi:putative LOC100569746 [Trichonephila clavipes]|nr:putative LOC100569746 [Trichonephila clavipes]